MHCTLLNNYVAINTCHTLDQTDLYWKAALVLYSNSESLQSNIKKYKKTNWKKLLDSRWSLWWNIFTGTLFKCTHANVHIVNSHKTYPSGNKVLLFIQITASSTNFCKTNKYLMLWKANMCQLLVMTTRDVNKWQRKLFRNHSHWFKRSGLD